MDENMNINNENNQNVENEQSDIRFDVENKVDVVSSAPAKKNNKLPVIIAAAVLLIAVICGIVWFAVSNKNSNNPANEEISTDEYDYAAGLLQYIEQNMDEEMTNEEGQSISREEYISKIQSVVSEATTSVSDNVGAFNPNTIVENTTAPITQGAQAQDTAQIEKAEASIKAFPNRTCYIKGAMYGGGEGSALIMSMDGNNFEALTNLEGTEVAMLSLDGKLYIKRPATKQYLELTDTVMDLLGINADEFKMDFGTASDYSEMQKKLVGTYDVTINGRTVFATNIKNDDQIYRFYTVDGSIKEIDICDSTGYADTQLVIDYFSTAIPGDQLTLKGYTASSVTVIFADLM